LYDYYCVYQKYGGGWIESHAITRAMRRIIYKIPGS
jgi:hypothetical protein